MKPKFEETTERDQRVPVEFLLERTRHIAKHCSLIAPETERKKRVPTESMQLMRDADLFRIIKPKAFGGFEYGPAEFMRVAFELGRACGSTGWCGSLAIFYHLILSYFPQHVQEEVYASSNDLVAVSYMPSRDCEVVEGGFSIGGEWAYASNCDNAGWFMVAVIVQDEDNPQQIFWMLAPATEFTIDHQSWNVVGMQGTGSKTIQLNRRIFVPAARSIPLSDIQEGTVPGVGIPGNSLARYRFSTFGPTGLVAPILGMAQGALDEFIAAARGRIRQIRPGMALPVINSVRLQARIGEVSARIDAAKELLLQSLARAAERISCGEELTVEERVKIRRNQGFAAMTAVRSVDELFAHTGTGGSSLSNPLQRFWRDANAAASHASLDWDTLSAMSGQSDLGIDVVGSY